MESVHEKQIRESEKRQISKKIHMSVLLCKKNKPLGSKTSFFSQTAGSHEFDIQCKNNSIHCASNF